ncbi:MAG: radical SAM protein [Anaerolineae bacterium]|nr:radical SAM protein [Anaerolineae bacterium]
MTEHAYPYKHFAAYLPPGNPTFGNPSFAAAPYRILIARLSPFRDVDRSIPHLYLFQEARRALPGAYIDLSFLPTVHERAQLAAHGLSPWIGTQSRQPAHAFDLILISNAYTLELINLPYLLLHAQIPLYASQRGDDDSILLLGGSNAMAAQAMIRPDGDSLVDGIFFGEGEGQVGPLIACLAEAPATGGSGMRRAALARAAAAVDGLWVAGGFQETRKAVCAPDARALATDAPLLNTPEAHAANLQIDYGCPAFCAFCFEGYDRKPYRELPLPDLLDAARRLKRAQGVPEVSLYSFNFNTYAQILPLLLELHRLYYRVTVKSQRADILQHAGLLLEAELAAGKQRYTLGIEGISARQRAWLHKSLPTADILALLARLYAAPIREVKLFFLLTGHEDEADLAEFRDLVRQVKALRRAANRGHGARTVMSFGLLVRMPHTPLRYDRLTLDRDAWRPLIGQVKSICETNGLEFRMAFDWDAYCVTQVLALGGYWLCDPVVDLARAGHCFDTALPDGYWDQLRARLAQDGRWDDAFLGAKGPDYPFALEHVVSRISPAFLYQQYQEARDGVDAGYCLGTQDERGRCLGCGACLDPAQREAITDHRLHLPDAAPYLAALRDVVRRKRRLRPAWYVIRTDVDVTGVDPATLNALVFRALLERYPALVDLLLDVRESLYTLSPAPEQGQVTKRGRFPCMGGESIYGLYAWDRDALRAILSASCHREPAPFAPWQSTRAPGDAAPSLSSLVHVLGPAEGFTPGLFVRCRLDLDLPAAHYPQARRVLAAYLQDAYLPYSLRREPAEAEDATRYRYEVPAKGLRKRILFGGWFEECEAGLRAALEIGPKFDLMDLLERFAPAYHVPYAGLRISQIAWT